MDDTKTDLPRLMSQADFARLCGVSPGRVSQWKSLAENILRDEAFEKPGRKGRLITAVALEHVRKYRDLGQALGNGIGTRTDGAPPAAEQKDSQPGPGPGREDGGVDPAAPPAAAPGNYQDDPPGEVGGADRHLASAPPANGGDEAQQAPTRPAVTVQDQLAEQKLRAQVMSNRRAAREEALERGLLMPADEARDRMAQIAGRMMRIFDGAMPDFAAALAENFGVPQRDALHVLRATFTKVRESVATKERAEADGRERIRTAQIDIGE